MRSIQRVLLGSITSFSMTAVTLLTGCATMTVPVDQSDKTPPRLDIVFVGKDLVGRFTKFEFAPYPSRMEAVNHPMSMRNLELRGEERFQLLAVATDRQSGVFEVSVTAEVEFFCGTPGFTSPHIGIVTDSSTGPRATEGESVRVQAFASASCVRSNIVYPTCGDSLVDTRYGNLGSVLVSARAHNYAGGGGRVGYVFLIQ